MNDYIDPRGRDPRFPDRPTHPDFVALSEAVQTMDHRAEVDREPIPDILGVDMDSFLYLVKNRLGTLSQRTGRDLTADPLFMSLYLDAFTLGKHYAERGD